MTEPKLCDSSVKQYSGYLDVGEDKVRLISGASPIELEWSLLSPRGSCLPNVDSRISDALHLHLRSQHLFFWFFESRNDPKNE